MSQRTFLLRCFYPYLLFSTRCSFNALLDEEFPHGTWHRHKKNKIHNFQIIFLHGTYKGELNTRWNKWVVCPTMDMDTKLSYSRTDWSLYGCSLRYLSPSSTTCVVQVHFRTFVFWESWLVTDNSVLVKFPCFSRFTVGAAVRAVFSPRKAECGLCHFPGITGGCFDSIPVAAVARRHLYGGGWRTDSICVVFPLVSVDLFAYVWTAACSSQPRRKPQSWWNTPCTRHSPLHCKLLGNSAWGCSTFVLRRI